MHLALLPLLALAGDPPTSEPTAESTEGSPAPAEAPPAEPAGAVGPLLGGGSADGIGGLPRTEPPKPQSVTVALGKPEVRGSLGGLTTAMKGALPQFSYCYQKEQHAAPEVRMAGTVTVRFVVEPSGAVSSSAVERSTMNAPAVESCVAGRVGRLQFSAPKTAVTVSYPLVFTPPPEE